MDRVVLQRDDQPANPAAGRYPVAILQVTQHFLPFLGFALLKIKRGKDKKQGEQQKDAQAATGRAAALEQQQDNRVVHHAKIAFTAARTLASRKWESLYPDL